MLEWEWERTTLEPLRGFTSRRAQQGSLQPALPLLGHAHAYCRQKNWAACMRPSEWLTRVGLGMQEQDSWYLTAQLKFRRGFTTSPRC